MLFIVVVVVVVVVAVAVVVDVVVVVGSLGVDVCSPPSSSLWSSLERFRAGIFGGGAMGVREGFAKAPNRRSRVLLNSVMNHAGKKGSLYGNTFAVLGEEAVSAWGGEGRGVYSMPCTRVRLTSDYLQDAARPLCDSPNTSRRGSRAWCEQAMSAWSVKTRRAPSRHCWDERVYGGHTTTAMHGMGTPSPPPTPWSLVRLMFLCASAATYYTCAESLLDYCEVDQLGPVQQAGLGDIINPLLAGASTGLLYKSTGKIRPDCSMYVAAAYCTNTPGSVFPYISALLVGCLIGWLVGWLVG